ncbi:MAG: ExeA family protein [Thiohalomonadales bacterium]
MYESYYGLTVKPFSIQPDPEFLFFSRRHNLAYMMLECSIHNDAGYTVICGDIGCGKTTLVHHLINNYKSELTVGLLYNTPPHIENIMQWILLAFELPFEDLSDISMHHKFQLFLINNYNAGKKTVLIIDEAQNLTVQSLEALRMLSNMSDYKHQLLQIILVGQPQLKVLLMDPGLEQFNQRVSVEFFLTPLEVTEIKAYIRHRIKVAGRDDDLFTKAAYERIATSSKGTPRVINILCDLVLVYGFSSETNIIDVDLVNEVIKDKEQYGVFSVK